MIDLWNRLSISLKLMAGFAIVTTLVVVSSIFTLGHLKKLNDAARQSAMVDGPLVQIAEEIRFLLANGHLELEELLTGDKTNSLQSVFDNWMRAKTYAEVILKGGKIKNWQFGETSNQQVKEAVEGFLLQHNYMISMANKRYKKMSNTQLVAAGSDLDQQFDAIYGAAITLVEELKSIFELNSGQSDNKIVEEYLQSRNELISTLVVVVLLSIVIPLLIANYVVLRPLTMLCEHVNKISKGELNARMESMQSDEFGRLAEAFNTMGTNLINIVGNVQKSGIQLSSSATTMAATAKQQEASAKEQEATTNQIMASSREISQTGKELVKSMDAVAQAVDDAASLAEQGRNGLSRMGNTIQKMVDASKSISGKLAVLNEKASNITSVVTTINKVADQTNLLSVNAAIEADKAGEYGVGFGTVATEIRRLADQTAVATYDIEEMVKEMQSAVSAGVMGMEKFSDEVRQGVEETHIVNEQLSQIVERVQALAPHFESVHESMYSQSQGAEQIQEALSQLGETIRGMNDSMRQSNKVVDELNIESNRMQQAVSEFKLSA